MEGVSDFLAPADEEPTGRAKAAQDRRCTSGSSSKPRHGLRPGMDLAGAVRGARTPACGASFAVDCVECGACNFVCCTCHCFLLADGTASDNVPVRGKQWDSCLLMNFARVAGGANPRAGRAARLRNRFQKKFSYFPECPGLLRL